MRSNANISFYPVRWEYAFHIPNCTFMKRQKTLQNFSARSLVLLSGFPFTKSLPAESVLDRWLWRCPQKRENYRFPITFVITITTIEPKKYIINGHAHELKESFSRSAGITQTPTTHMSILIQNNGQKIFDSELNFLKNNCIQKTKIENRQNPRKGLK